MAYPTEEIAEAKEMLTAIKTALLEAVKSGGVEEFRQGTTWIKKASVQDLKNLRNQTENELHRLESL